MELIISRGTLTRESLAGKTAIITGPGGQIGYEAARALIWLGARVVIAEIENQNGIEMERQLNREYGEDSALFVQTDVGDESSIRRLSEQARVWGSGVDIVVNAATVAPLGAVTHVPIDAWDGSYRVNLRGPVLMAQAFIPDMVARGEGAFICGTAEGAGYTGAYETFKKAQEHLAVTLTVELSGCGIWVCTVRPGCSPIPSDEASIHQLAETVGVPESELRLMVSPQNLSPEAAGAGIAAAVTLAERFHGMEVSSIKALRAAGIELIKDQLADKPVQRGYSDYNLEKIRMLSSRSRDTLLEQSTGWHKRPIFEQQWLSRSFEKYSGATVEEWLKRLETIENAAIHGRLEDLREQHFPLEDLIKYYRYMAEAAEGDLNDHEGREIQIRIVRGWQREIEELDQLLRRKEHEWLKD